MTAEIRPGYKTIGFYAALVLMAVSFLVNGDVIDGGLKEKIVATIGAIVTSAGYAALRSYQKPAGLTKPAWKTTEMWLSLAAGIVGALYAAGIFDAGGPADRILGVATMILAGMGYVVNKPGKA